MVHCIDIIRFVKRNVYHIFPLKKEETNQLKRANSKDDEDTSIVLPWHVDHWLVEALIIKEDIPTLSTVQLSFDIFAAVLPSSCLTSSIQCLYGASSLTSPTIRLNLTKDKHYSAFAPSSSSPPSLCNWFSNTLENDKSKMTTETLHTVIQYKYKHYEKWACFLLIFIQNVRGASATRSLVLLLLDMRFWYLRWNNYNCYCFYNNSMILEDIRNSWDRTDAQH